MGLMADWKKTASQKGDVALVSWYSQHVTTTRPTGSNKSEVDLVNAESEYVGGEYHDDEKAESVLAARATKGGNVTRVKYEVRPYLSLVSEYQLTSSHITDPYEHRPNTLCRHRAIPARTWAEEGKVHRQRPSLSFRTWKSCLPSEVASTIQE
jgi:hypothetical protein